MSLEKTRAREAADDYAKRRIKVKLADAQYKDGLGMELKDSENFVLDNKHFFKRMDRMTERVDKSFEEKEKEKEMKLRIKQQQEEARRRGY